jgi:uncharacterized protein with PhoU and TrkA domain
MAKLLDLAKADLTKDKDAKALEQLSDKVEDNKMSFENSLTLAKREVRDAEKAIAILAKNPDATPSQVIAAEDALALATANVEQLSRIIAERF